MMNQTRSVTFSLAPVVHLYKKLCDFVVNAEENPEPQNIIVEAPAAPAAPQQSLKLTIEIPWASLPQEKGPTPPPYDNSPLSPKTQREILWQRVQETETRRSAIEEAFANFYNSVTPASQQTPTSIVGDTGEQNSPISPINLSPR